MSIMKEFELKSMELEKLKDEVEELRKKLPITEINDYVFIDNEGKEVKLSSLFNDGETLIMVHNMGRQCPYCTTWADGFSDSYYRIAEKVPFIVTSKENYKKQRDNIKERNWKFKMVSSENNSFLEDLHFRDGNIQNPGLMLLTKDKEGKIFKGTMYIFGPGDDFGMLWHILNLSDAWKVEDY